jgi:hypothetical protein
MVNILTLIAAGLALTLSINAQTTPAAQAFEHYEGVRKALASDKLADAAPHAKQLIATVEPVGGAEAKKSADALAAATKIEDARKHFAALSAILVPKVQEANIPGAYAYMCSMENASWMQRGKAIENPYYGKSMLTCGTAITKTPK